MIAGRATLVAVMVGGALGAVARLALVEAVPIDAGGWPWATLSANVAGSALLGFASVRLSGPWDRPFRAAVEPGFCGALTTFSAVQLEILLMLDAGRGGLAGLYLGASIAACLVAVTAGSRMAGRGAAA